MNENVADTARGKVMTRPMTRSTEAKDAAQAANLLVIVATSLNERLLITAEDRFEAAPQSPRRPAKRPLGLLPR